MDTFIYGLFKDALNVSSYVGLEICTTSRTLRQQYRVISLVELGMKKDCAGETHDRMISERIRRKGFGKKPVES
jgi:hypothetical protein